MRMRKEPQSKNYYSINKLIRRNRYYQFKKDNPDKIAKYAEKYRLKIKDMLKHLPTEKEDNINLLSDEFIISIIKKLYDIIEKK